MKVDLNEKRNVVNKDWKELGKVKGVFETRKRKREVGKERGKGMASRKKTPSVSNSVPLIQSEVVVVVDQDQPDSLTLRYTWTPVQSSKFDLYRFRISDARNTTKQKMVDDIDRKVTFTGLTPGKLYNVTVWTVSNNVESRPLLRQDRLCEYLSVANPRPNSISPLRLISKRIKRKEISRFRF